jgi:hypothetical protein
MIHAFTSSTVSYLPKVRLLAKSLKEHHPDVIFHLVLVDETPDWLKLKNEPFDSIIPLDGLEFIYYKYQKNSKLWKQWVFCHDVVELCTAIKPFVLKYLLNKENCTGVFYFDPDIVVFSPLDNLFKELESSSILLTPHLTKPEKSLEAILDNELCSLKHGIFNLGFIGVSPTADGISFANWWTERLYHFCRADIATGLFTDQKWIDFVPVFFDNVKILKSPRFNVAPWNLTNRKLSGNFKTGFKVEGEPLGFYHFTGFDSGAHKIMAVKNGGFNETVLSLVDWYENQIKSDQKGDISNTKWVFETFSNGEKIIKKQRELFRDNAYLIIFRNPFDSEGDSYYKWLNKHKIKKFIKNLL